mmetsp:Transcript_43070/g.93796  ORF Transcript_43070/g.93796 Transcript_43070/m.93796 type:complete len:202 (+) Transcript_43070:302-907(+)
MAALSSVAQSLETLLRIPGEASGSGRCPWLDALSAREVTHRAVSSICLTALFHRPRAWVSTSSTTTGFSASLMACSANDPTCSSRETACAKRPLAPTVAQMLLAVVCSICSSSSTDRLLHCSTQVAPACARLRIWYCWSISPALAAARSAAACAVETAEPTPSTRAAPAPARFETHRGTGPTPRARQRASLKWQQFRVRRS